MKKIILTLVLLLCLFLNANAQNYSDALRLSETNLGSSARSLGMGNAYHSVGGDPASFLLNPAGLALIHSGFLSAGLNYNTFENESSLFGNAEKYTVSNTNFNNGVYAYSFPVTRGSMAIAFAFNRVQDYNYVSKFSGFNSNNNSMIQEMTDNNDDLMFQLGLSYPLYDGGGNYLKDTTRISGNLNQSGMILKEGYKDYWTIGFATEAAKNVFIGMNISYISGKYHSDREYYESDTRDYYGAGFQLDPEDSRTAGFERFALNDFVDWRFTGWELQFGFLAKMMNFLKIGASVKLPVAHKITEDYLLNGSSNFAYGYSFIEKPFYSDRIQYKITSPFEFTGGASIKLLILKVAGSITFKDYTQMSFGGGMPKDVISDNNKLIKDVFVPGIDINLGAELKIPFLDLRGRAGVIYKTSPYAGDPAEFDKKYLTAGIGLMNEGGFSLDVAYALGWWEEYTDNYGVDLSRVRHKVITNTLMLTVTMAVY